jgi:hypothetical protein
MVDLLDLLPPTQVCCKNCKFWEKPANGNYGECMSEKLDYDSSIGYSDKHIKEMDKLLYFDMEHYSASFKTGPEFGCIHFQEKVYSP